RDVSRTMLGRTACSTLSRPCRLKRSSGHADDYRAHDRRSRIWQLTRENMMHDKQTAAPDSTAVRVALWRAMHVEIDPPPHVFEDEIGLRLVAPEDDWRRRPDMDSHFTKPFRA